MEKLGEVRVEDNHGVTEPANDAANDGRWTKHVEDARAANDREHEVTIRQALRDNWKAVAWSLTVSMSIIMEGYDTSLINNFYAFPAFKQQFGRDYGDAGLQVPGDWQSGLSAGSTSGALFGAFINGWAIKAFGFRPTFIASLAMMTGFIFVSFFGKTLWLQVLGQVLCSIPWGIFATIGPAYASEILPLALRPYLTAYTNMCFAIGQFISAGVLKGMVDRTDQWAYRIPYAVQWVWPVPLMIIAFWMPESPWWLSRNGRHDEAEKTLSRLSTAVDRDEARRTVAMMIRTNEMEMELVKGTSYIDCFRGSNARRTEIACVSFAGQVLCGSQFAFSPSYFLLSIGVDVDVSYALSLGGTAIAFTGTILVWLLMKVFGRRQLYLTGLGVMALCLFLIGILEVGNGQSLVWGQAALCLVWLFTFSMSVGPIGWLISPEVSSTRLRAKTIVLARNTYYVVIIVANVISPKFINPTELNWKGYTGFFWFGSAMLTLTWAFFRLPETKDRTFGELDVMFGAKVPTRQFKKYKVDAYTEDVAIADRAHLEESEAQPKEKV
jgi:SP family general alpha glucoside:H+ symporter-like MFS transporter